MFAMGALVACAEDPGDARDQAADELPPVSGDLIPANRFAEDFPAIASLEDADVWVACQQWDGRQDAIVLGMLTEWESEQRALLYTSPMHIHGVAMARGPGSGRGVDSATDSATDPGDVLHVLWSEQVEDGWALRGVEVAPPRGEAGVEGPRDLSGTVVSEPRTVVSAADGNCTDPQLVADDEGRLLLAWVAVHRGGLTLRARAHVPGVGWGDVIDVAQHFPRNQWAPDLTVVGPGRFAAVWDAASDGNFDIYLARLAIDEAAGDLRVTDHQRVTDSPRYEAQASVAAAGERLYVAYEVGGENWGREGSVNKLDEALHVTRRIEVVAVDSLGLGAVVAPIAVPFMDGVSKGLQDGCEQPRLQVDGGGNLVMFFRGLTLPDTLHDAGNKQFQQRAQQRQGAGVGWRTSIWFSFMSRFDGVTWDIDGTHQQAIRGSNGRGDAPIALGRLKQGGTAHAVVGDARERQAAEATGNEGEVGFTLNWWEPISTESTLVTTGRLRKGAPAGPLPLGEARPTPKWPTAGGGDPPMPPRQEVDGRTLELALGDLHRHTDLSRCSSNWDGPFTEALRYGYDVGGLQFMAVTDHFEHMTRYDWWRSLAMMDQYDAPGRFVNLRAYERADAQTGHRNVISGSEVLPMVAYRKEFQEGRDDARANSPDDLWKHFAGEQLLTIPHTPAGMYEASASVFDWLSFNPEYDRVVEIFQSYRGSSEEFEGPRAIPSSFPKRFARPNLDGGLHFGFIASSDHQSSYGAFAGTWTTGLSRGEIFEALHARRTFASTARMKLWAEWDGVPLGEIRREEPTASGTLTLLAGNDSGAWTFSKLELIVDGVVVQTRDVSDHTLNETFEGPELGVPQQGTRYVYVRVTTADGELGWTSPIRRGLGAVLPDGPLGVDAYDDVTGPALQRQFPSGATWRGGAPEGR